MYRSLLSPLEESINIGPCELPPLLFSYSFQCVFSKYTRPTLICGLGMYLDNFSDLEPTNNEGKLNLKHTSQFWYPMFKIIRNVTPRIARETFTYIGKHLLERNAMKWNQKWELAKSLINPISHTPFINVFSALQKIFRASISKCVHVIWQIEQKLRICSYIETWQESPIYVRYVFSLSSMKYH